MMRARILLPTLVAAATLLGMAGEAAACACCSNRGQRNVGTQAYDESFRSQVEQVTFKPNAELYLGSGEADPMEGIDQPDSNYDLAVSRDGTSITFVLKGHAGQSGSLKLALPQRISIFEVDPRNTPDTGLGPPLYKEWKLSGSVTGEGSFAAASLPGHTLTLILQGGGNSCTSAIDFTHWTLVMEGPKANYMLIGDLLQTE